MRRSVLSLIAVVVVLVAVSSVAAQTAPVSYSEALDGDLPGNAPFPSFTLGEGTNLWNGTIETTPPEQLDAWTAVLPENHEITAIRFTGPGQNGSTYFGFFEYTCGSANQSTTIGRLNVTFLPPITSGCSLIRVVSRLNIGADPWSVQIDVIHVPPPTSDLTPPVVTPTVSGTLGNNNWYTSDVNLSWSTSDPDSAISSRTGCETSLVTADTHGMTFTCSATSDGGTASSSVTIMRDATPPVVSATASPEPNADGWNNTDVTVTFSGTDALSGNLVCDSPVILTADGMNQSATGTCTDEAGNSAQATVYGVNIDKTAIADDESDDEEPDHEQAGRKELDFSEIAVKSRTDRNRESLSRVSQFLCNLGIVRLASCERPEIINHSNPENHIFTVNRPRTWRVMWALLILLDIS